MAKKPAKAVTVPPFPPLAWDKDSDAWEATTILPMWAGCWDGHFVRRKKPSNGRVRLVVQTHERRKVPPTPEQAAAFQFLLDHGEAVRGAVLKAVFRKYPSCRRKAAEVFGDDPDELALGAPPLTAAEQLAGYAGVGEVFVHPVAAKGLAYVGFAFHCTWDPGHGFGVLTHGKRVVKVSDDSELAWDAAVSRLDADRRR